MANIIGAAPLASPTFTGTVTLPATVTSGSYVSTFPSKSGTFAMTSDITSEIQLATVSVSSADILALHTTPITLIASPGSGKITVVDQVIYNFTAGTQYANGQSTLVSYAGLTDHLVNSRSAAQLIGHVDSSIQSVYPQADSGDTVILTGGSNKAVTFGLTSATAFTTGTGTLKIYIKYRTVTL